MYKTFLTLLAIFFISCNTNTNIFHVNNNIDTLIQRFNDNSKQKISVPKNEFSYQVFYKLKYTSGRISSNKTTTYIDISAVIYYHNFYKILRIAKKYLEILDTGFTKHDLQYLRTKLLSGKYQYYDKLKYKGLEFGLQISKKIDGAVEYKFTIIVKNKHIQKLRNKYKGAV